MINAKEAKQISAQGIERLDYIIDEILSGRMVTEKIIRNNLTELIEIERMDAAIKTIDNYPT